MKHPSPIHLFSAFLMVIGTGAAVPASGADTPPGQSNHATSSAVLKDKALRNYVDTFNSKDHTHFGQAISNETTADWMANNVPRFGIDSPKGKSQ